MRCFSHPDKELIFHLENVKKIGLNIFRQKQKLQLNFPADFIEQALSIALYYHDIGKATLYFQDYLQSSISGQKYTHNDNLRKHALISAVYAGYKTFLTIKPKDTAVPLALLSLITVLKHHGDLEDILDMVHIKRTRWKDVKEQWSALQFDAIRETEPLDFEDTKNFIVDLPYEIDDIEKSVSLYFLMNLFFSIITYADKNEAAFSESAKLKTFNNILLNSVDTFKKERLSGTSSQLNDVRNEIYQEAMKISKSNRLLSLNVPTGSGKTLAAVNLALKMLDRDPTLTKVIYALPFTSIIDQTEKVLNNVFKNSGLDPFDYLAVHHHLAEAKIKINEDYMRGDSAQFIIENWDSFFVLTTFWQFFHSLISSKNRQLRKVHNLADSVIILDEVQTIPYEYWQLANHLLKQLVETFNCKIVFLTATMPLIFSEDEIYSLIEKNRLENYFHVFSRYKLIIVDSLNMMNIEELAEKATVHIGDNPDKSFLFVLNTIKSSLEFFNLLKDNFPDEELIYISSNILPVDRIKKIERIKNKTDRMIVVSTQIIEAGVDIDLDIVYRDFAPLDSIIQTAGRCNRNNRNILGGGRVYLIKLADSKERFYCNYIYSKVPLHATEEILKEIAEVEENKILDLIHLYYNKVKCSLSHDVSRKIIQYITELEYEKIESEFKLIKDEGIPDVLVFIEKDDRASDILDSFYKILDVEDRWEKKSRFLEIRKDFFSYTLSLRISKENAASIKNFKDIGNFKIINKEMADTYYKEDTGYTNEFDNFF